MALDLLWSIPFDIFCIIIVFLQCIQPLTAPCNPTDIFMTEPITKNVAEDITTSTVFTCTTYPTISPFFLLHFKLNGTRFPTIISTSVGEELSRRGITFLQTNNHSIALQINNSHENNNTTIECVAVDMNDDQECQSNSAQLFIEGLLAAPGGLHAFNMIGLIPQPVVLRWDAPFSLDITGVDRDISNYTLFITNLNTSRNGSVTVTGTEFEFTNLMGEAPNPCYIHSFTVSAVNLAGEGNRSEPVMGNIRGDAPPTLMELIKFPGQDGRINIPQDIGVHYMTFGIFLLEDPNGVKIRVMERKHMKDAKQINIEIFQEWVEGRGKQPVTWGTLVDALHDTELINLANEIAGVKSVTPTTVCKRTRLRA